MDRWRLDVLGPLALRSGDTDATPSSAIARRLLALLACRAPEVVPVGELVGVAWPDDRGPREPMQNLHTHVARIRRLVGALPGEPGIIATEPGGYRLVTSDGTLELDLHELAELTAGGLAVDGDASTRDRLTRALALWRGPSLVDIADTDAGRGDAVRLDELRRSIAEARFECLLADGRAADLVPDLEAFALANPYRERPVAVLVRALAHLGRHADALATYQRFRARLAEDLGLEPSPALRDLETDVLAHRQTAPAAATDAAPRRGPYVEHTTRPPARLPARVAPLVGRDDELAVLEAALARSRLVTVLGPGGVGKTRLALEVANRRQVEGADAGRVLWCDLASADDEAGVLAALARTVDAHRQPDESSRDAVVRAVAGIGPALVLDNCEQVVDPVADLAAAIVGRSERVRVLTTSRAALDVPGEVVVRLAPLSCDAPSGRSPAVELFLARCAAAGVDVVEDDTTLAEATRICRAVDGLPLGVELAAAQLRNMGLAQLAGRLEDERGPLEVARRRGPAWQRSIGATLDWSYRLLEPEDQRLLAAVSSFAGGFDATAAASVLGTSGPDEVEDRLRGLCDLSLVNIEPDAHDLSLLDIEPDAHDLRFRLLGTTRRFGRRMLARQGGEAEVLARHRDRLRALVAEARVAMRGPEEGAAARLLDRHVDDIGAVLHRAAADGDADTSLGICWALGEFAFHRLRDDVVAWTEAAVGMPAASGHPLHGRTLAVLAKTLTSRGVLDRAERCAHQALRSAPDDRLAVLAAHHALTLVALYRGRLPEAEEAALLTLAAAEAADDDLGALIACALVGLVRCYGGDPGDAGAWMERSMSRAERAGQPSALAWSQYGRGEVLGHLDADAAALAYGRAIALGEAVGNVFVVGVAEVSLAALRARSSDPVRALEAFGPLIRRWDAGNDWTHQWTTLQNLAPLAARAGAEAAAAMIVGALTAATERSPFGDAADGIAELETLLAASLGVARHRELRARGAAMSRRQVIDLGLRLADGDGSTAPEADDAHR